MTISSRSRGICNNWGKIICNRGKITCIYSYNRSRVRCNWSTVICSNSCCDVYRGNNHMLRSICVCNSDTGKRKFEVICILNIVIYSNSTALYYGVTGVR
jgi:hypothetical protein